MLHCKATPRASDPHMNAGPSLAAARLQLLKASLDCVQYCSSPLPETNPPRALAIYGSSLAGEIFVEVSDGATTRVQSFISRHKNCPPEVRRCELPLVDTADAFALARVMGRRWPRKASRGSQSGASAL